MIAWPVAHMVKQICNVFLTMSVSLTSAETQYSHQGLVKGGQPNLCLFNQLYWTILCSFLLVLHAIFPLPHLIRCVSPPPLAFTWETSDPWTKWKDFWQFENSNTTSTFDLGQHSQLLQFSIVESEMFIWSGVHSLPIRSAAASAFCTTWGETQSLRWIELFSLKTTLTSRYMHLYISFQNKRSWL